MCVFVRSCRRYMLIRLIVILVSRSHHCNQFLILFLSPNHVPSLFHSNKHTASPPPPPTHIHTHTHTHTDWLSAWIDLQMILQCQAFAVGPENDRKQGRQLNPGAEEQTASLQAEPYRQGHSATEYDLNQPQQLALLLRLLQIKISLSASDGFLIRQCSLSSKLLRYYVNWLLLCLWNGTK